MAAVCIGDALCFAADLSYQPLVANAVSSCVFVCIASLGNCFIFEIFRDCDTYARPEAGQFVATMRFSCRAASLLSAKCFGLQVVGCLSCWFGSALSL